MENLNNNKVDILKLQSFLDTLKATESFLKYTSKNDVETIKFLKQLHAVLLPYKSMEAHIFLKKLENILNTENKEYKIKNNKFTSALFSENEIKNWDFNTLKYQVINNKLKKDDLLMIAKHALNMPTGPLQNLKKEFIRDKILNTIDNVEKLDTIKKIAKK